MIIDKYVRVENVIELSKLLLRKLALKQLLFLFSLGFYVTSLVTK